MHLKRSIQITFTLKMFNFLTGTVFGIVIATIGVTNVASLLNDPIQEIQKFALDQSAKQTYKKN
jgi:hypothetical protein